MHLFRVSKIDIVLQKRLQKVHRLQTGTNRRDILKLMSVVMEDSLEVQKRVTKRLGSLGIKQASHGKQ